MFSFNPRLSNEDVCLYDSNGNVNPVSPSTICVRSLETQEEGRLCVPLEPAMNSRVYAFKNHPFRIMRHIMGSVLTMLPPLLLTMGLFMLCLLLLGLLTRLIWQLIIYSKRKLQKDWGHLSSEVIFADSRHTANVYILRFFFVVNSFTFPLLGLLLLLLVLVDFLTLPCLVTSSAFKVDPLLRTFEFTRVTLISGQTMCHRRFSFRIILFCVFVSATVLKTIDGFYQLCKRRKDIWRISRFVMKIDAIRDIFNANYGLMLETFLGTSNPSQILLLGHWGLHSLLRTFLRGPQPGRVTRHILLPSSIRRVLIRHCFLFPSIRTCHVVVT